jgi:Sulfotransferase family
MQNQVDKPIFVAGSPRSGTSVLTWCLGQHPNIVPLPESGWMGDFAIDLAIRYQIGAARGDRSVLSAMDIQSDEFFASFGQTINQLIQRHRKDLERKRSGASRTSSGGIASTAKKRGSKSEPQKRWVDGTPEYSFHICGLRKLFPKALFIHLVRDVRSVVRSMLNFHRVAGHHLFNNEQEAYNYWFRTVSSCLLAERAYGPRVVLRLRYSDLLNAPEIAMRSVLEFIGERYTTACLNPLGKRINSSNVPIDFEIDNSRTDPALLERAARLCAEVEETPQPPEASSTAVEEMEAAFEERVRYVATLDDEYYKALQEMTRLQEIIAGLQADPRVQDPNATAN